MKKLVVFAAIVFACACNSSTEKSETTGSADSADIINPGAVQNDVPMRAVDTSKNLMMDTTRPRDTISKP